jgi:hypothetical protein
LFQTEEEFEEEEMKRYIECCEKEGLIYYPPSADYEERLAQWQQMNLRMHHWFSYMMLTMYREYTKQWAEEDEDDIYFSQLAKGVDRSCIFSPFPPGTVISKKN